MVWVMIFMICAEMGRISSNERVSGRITIQTEKYSIPALSEREWEAKA
jgi:hypothetical protein